MLCVYKVTVLYVFLRGGEEVVLGRVGSVVSEFIVGVLGFRELR